METAIKPRIIASPTSWIDGEAVRQLHSTAALPGMRVAVGLPDLHAGKGHPIGASFACCGRVYPFLVGSDIGCGMALYGTDLAAHKAKRDRWVSKLSGLEAPWDGDVDEHLARHALEGTGFDHSLGTIGGGNHFAELQAVDGVFDAVALREAGLDADRLVLLVHSGSRGLGESILRAHTDKLGAQSLEEGSEGFSRYLAAHDRAVRWAKANRALIAERFASCIGADIEQRLDITHNDVSRVSHEQEDLWLHRKGAAPADRGLVVIPGSRGHMSFLCRPRAASAESGWSLAHGAGRKWTRADARSRLKSRYRPAELQRTALGGAVICEDRDLLYEEAPEAYKGIERVIADLVEAGLCDVVATLRPIITYKTRASERDD